MVMPKHKSPKLTDPGVSVVALPPQVKERLRKMKLPGEPFYKLIGRLMDFYTDE